MNPFLLFFLVNSLIQGAPIPNFPFPYCDTPNFTNNKPYEASLANLLSIYSTVTGHVLKFFNTSVGTDSDRVYGLFWCYEYSTDDQCLNCLQRAVVDIQKSCMNKYEAWVWEDHCLFRYSTQNFYGQLNVTGIKTTKNQKNVTEPEKFRYLVNGTFLNLTKLAAFNASYNMHAEGGVVFTSNNTVYAFVQCTEDLSPENCNTCLEYGARELLEKNYFAKGARFLSRSCYLRYEPYEFFKSGAHLNVSQPSQNLVPKTNKPLKNWVIAVIALGSGMSLLSVAGGCVLFCVNRKRSKDIRTSNNEEMQTLDEDDDMDRLKKLDPDEFPFIEMKVMERATDSFSDLNKLGEGGFGPVYKGRLPDGQDIAVKRLSSSSQQGTDEFINEVRLIHKLQHVNLVRLLGCTVEGEEKLLIYEYMPNGSLDHILADLHKRAQLDWSTRLRIINGVSRGMLYLHQDSRLKIIHRDLKPSNVLLDAEMNPKISDFGTARIFVGSNEDANTARKVGTFGYMAPEFAMEGIYSIKSDVFSFGVLLIEIITGKRNVGFHVTRLAPSLVAYAWKLWGEERGHELMDRLLVDACPKEEFLRCLHIGLLCVQEDAQDRPSMASVVVMLNEETVGLAQPQQPAFIVGKFDDHYATCVNNLTMNELTISQVLPR